MSAFSRFAKQIANNGFICRLCNPTLVGRIKHYYDDTIHSHIYYKHILIMKIPGIIVHCHGTYIELISNANGKLFAHSADKTVKTLFPQLLFLTVQNVKSFSIELRDILDTGFSGLVMDDEVFDFGDRSASIINLITTNANMCVFCGDCYEMGFPSMEIVFEHVIRCGATKSLLH